MVRKYVRHAGWEASQKPIVHPGGRTVTIINIKVTNAERRVLELLAQKYASGNLSQWLRIAGTHFRPQKPIVLDNAS